jgi:hypothetical protein
MGRQKAKLKGKSSFILTSDDRTPKLPTIWFRSASAVSEFGHPPEASGLRVTAPNCSGQVLLRQPIQMVPDHTIAGHPSGRYASIRRYVA